MMTPQQRATVRSLELEYGQDNVRTTTDDAESTCVDITGSYAHKYYTLLHNGRLANPVTIYDDFTYLVDYVTFTGVAHSLKLYVTDLADVIAALTKNAATVTSVTPVPTTTLTTPTTEDL